MALERKDATMSEKRSNTRIRRILIPALIFLSVFFVAGLLIAVGGNDPIKAYTVMIQGSLGSVEAITETVLKMVPIMLIGVAVCICFRAGFRNIGGEGQLQMGALGATSLGLFFRNYDFSPWAVIPLVMIAGMVLGAVWAMIPAFISSKYGVNDILLTLLMNYVGINIVFYFVSFPLRNPAVTEFETLPLAPAALLPMLIPRTRFHAGIPVAFAIVILTYMILWKTTLGFKFRSLGASPKAARYAGIKPVRTIMYASIIGGALPGIAGMMEVSAVHMRLVNGFSPGYGFVGVASALLAGLDPKWTFLTSFMLSIVLIGTGTMQALANVPSAMAWIIQGLLVIFMLFARRQRIYGA